MERELEPLASGSIPPSNASTASGSIPPSEAGANSSTKYAIKFNKHALPQNDEGTTTTKLCKLVKAHIPISYKLWTQVPDIDKKKVFNEMKIMFGYKDSQFNVTMCRANRQWRKHKHNMRQMLKGKTIE